MRDSLQPAVDLQTTAQIIRRLKRENFLQDEATLPVKSKNRRQQPSGGGRAFHKEHLVVNKCELVFSLALGRLLNHSFVQVAGTGSPQKGYLLRPGPGRRTRFQHAPRLHRFGRRGFGGSSGTSPTHFSTLHSILPLLPFLPRFHPLTGFARPSPPTSCLFRASFETESPVEHQYEHERRNYRCSCSLLLAFLAHEPHRHD